MSEQTRTILKTYFETNDFPVQSEFIDLIDSIINILDDKPALFASLHIPTDEVLTLFSDPITIINTPGAGKVIEVISASALLTFNTAAYTVITELYLTTATADQRQASIFNILQSTVTRHGKATITSLPVTATITQLLPDQALIVTTSGDPGVGDSNIDIFLSYRIIDIS